MNAAVPLTEAKDLESKSPTTSIDNEAAPLAEGAKAKADTPYIWTKKTDSNWDVTAVKE